MVALFPEHPTHFGPFSILVLDHQSSPFIQCLGYRQGLVSLHLFAPILERSVPELQQRKKNRYAAAINVENKAQYLGD